eukprot:334605_1
MSSSTTQITSLELLLSGYSQQLNIFLPLDILKLVALYYQSPEFDINIFSLCCSSLKILNLCTQQEKDTIIHYNDCGCFEYLTNSHCIANQIQLPSFIQTVQNTINSYSFFSQYLQKQKVPLIELIPDHLLSSNKWSIIFRIGSSLNKCDSYFTAFHRSSIKRITQDKVNDWIMEGYNFKLPSFPTHNTAEFGQFPSLIYNKSDDILYGMNVYNTENNHKTQGVFSLKCNVKNTENWKWENQNVLLNFSRYETSLCMVDNDRFIAILGGCDANYNAVSCAELYAINCRKSIPLPNMSLGCSRQIKSVYHKQFHRIIAADINHGLEWYDINKDIWITIADCYVSSMDGYQKLVNWYGHNYKKFSSFRDIFIPTNDPNCICIVGSRETNSDEFILDTFKGWSWIWKMDLRENNKQLIPLIEDSKYSRQRDVNDIYTLYL